MTSEFKKLLERDELILMPSIYDALSAKIVETAGFEVIGLSSMSTEASFGFTDTGMTTMTEVLERARCIVDSVSIPLIVDCDTGFGNALNVIRLTRELERAGCAGMQLEDQTFPKKCPLIREERSVISTEEMCGKIKAVCDTRMDENFVIMARTDARGEEETIRRLNAYVEAGADVCVPIWGVAIHRQEDGSIHIGPDIEVMKRYRREIDAPLNSIDMPAEIVEELGYEIAAFPTDAVRTAARAMLDYMKKLKRERRPLSEMMMSLQDFVEFVGASKYRTLEDKYLLKR